MAYVSYHNIALAAPWSRKNKSATGGETRGHEEICNTDLTLPYILSSLFILPSLNFSDISAAYFVRGTGLLQDYFQTTFPGLHLVSFVCFRKNSLEMSKHQAGSVKIKPKRLSIRKTRSPTRIGERMLQEAYDQDRESSLPPELRSRLWSLFAQIEREFEGVYAENIACKLSNAYL